MFGTPSIFVNTDVKAQNSAITKEYDPDWTNVTPGLPLKESEENLDMKISKMLSLNLIHFIHRENHKNDTFITKQ